MKLIIDIPEENYQRIKEYYEKNDIVEATYSYIVHGIPLEDIKAEISTYFNMIGTDKDYEQGYNNAIKRALTIIDKHIGVEE